MFPIQENAARKPSVNQIFEVFFDTYTNKPQSTDKYVFQVRKRIVYMVSAIWVLFELGNSKGSAVCLPPISDINNVNCKVCKEC